ncbi:MAG: TadE/TadG family type IV pilus assembly protein [Planctomycetota bacterium]
MPGSTLASTPPTPLAPAGPTGWWTDALASPASVRWGVFLAMAAVTAFWLLWTLSRSAKRAGPDGRPVRITLRERLRWLQGDNGTATIETVMVLPVLTAVVLLIIQLMLLMVGNLFVHYAAHAATRAAIVQVPRDLTATGGSEANAILPAYGAAKFDAIHAAAALALVPVSGKDGGTSAEATAFVDGLYDYYEQAEVEPPVWLDTLAGQRLDYARRHTVCHLLFATNPQQSVFERVGPALGHTYAPYHAIGVEVEHRLNITIPYMGVFFADGTHNTDTGDTPYTDVSARSVMPNQGLPTELPPAPSIPRRL